MSKYPEHAPQVFIDYLESQVVIDKPVANGEISPKALCELFIFDSRMQKIAKPLGKRFEEKGGDIIGVLSFLLLVSKASGGPSSWQGMTPKEQSNKIVKIKKMAVDLLEEIKGTPMDYTFINLVKREKTKDYFNNALKLLIREMRQKESHSEKVTKGIDDSFYTIAALSNAEVSDILLSLSQMEPSPDEGNAIKRRVNVKRLFFIREVAGYFKRNFGSYLYNITSVISSVVLNEQITIEDVRSATKK